MIGPPSQLALPLPLLSDLRNRERKPLHFLKFFIKWRVEKPYTLHVIYPYLCPPDCNGRYMDKHSGVMPLLLSNDSARVCRMACDMRSASWLCPSLRRWRHRWTAPFGRRVRPIPPTDIIIEPRRCSAMAVSSSGLFFCVPLDSVLHEHR